MKHIVTLIFIFGFLRPQLELFVLLILNFSKKVPSGKTRQNSNVFYQYIHTYILYFLFSYNILLGI